MFEFFIITCTFVFGIVVFFLVLNVEIGRNTSSDSKDNRTVVGGVQNVPAACGNIEATPTFSQMGPLGPYIGNFDLGRTSLFDNDPNFDVNGNFHFGCGGPFCQFSGD